MIRKPCAVCGRPSAASYCPQHAPKKTSPQSRGYTAAWRRHRNHVVAEHVAKYGLHCLGNQWCDVPFQRHYATNLVLDHDYGVMCRSANARKGGGYDKQPGKPTGGARENGIR